MKHVGIEIKFYNLDTFKKQIDVNFIDLDSNLVDLNYKVASLIFCHFWRSIRKFDSELFGQIKLKRLSHYRGGCCDSGTKTLHMKSASLFKLYSVGS